MKARHRLAEYLRSGSLPDQVAKDIRRILNNKKEILPGWTPSFLRRLGKIDVVIDVGVLEGTPALYDAFPDAFLVLVEALPMYEETCERILEGRKGDVHMCAAGAQDGTTVIRHYHDVPARSSLLQTARANELAFSEIDVPLRKLDTLLSDTTLNGSVLLKIDVEGMEHEVLRGAQKTLEQVKYVITETSIKRRHKNSYRFADLIQLMAQQQFDLFDVLTVTREKAMHPKASIMDAIFINSSLERSASALEITGDRTQADNGM